MHANSSQSPGESSIQFSTGQSSKSRQSRGQGAGGADGIRYKMSRNITTVTDAWCEYTTGLGAAAYAVRDLIAGNKHDWHIDGETGRRFFRRRRMLYQEVEFLISTGVAEADAVRQLENERAAKTWTLNKLSEECHRRQTTRSADHGDQPSPSNSTSTSLGCSLPELPSAAATSVVESNATTASATSRAAASGQSAIDAASAEKLYVNATAAAPRKSAHGAHAAGSLPVMMAVSIHAISICSTGAMRSISN